MGLVLSIAQKVNISKTANAKKYQFHFNLQKGRAQHALLTLIYKMAPALKFLKEESGMFRDSIWFAKKVIISKTILVLKSKKDNICLKERLLVGQVSLISQELAQDSARTKFLLTETLSAIIYPTPWMISAKLYLETLFGMGHSWIVWLDLFKFHMETVL